MELKKAGKQTLILEARDRVGGRSKAGEICGETIDLGGQWVGPQQKFIVVPSARARHKNISSIYQRGELSESKWFGQILSFEYPKLPVSALIEIALLERRWNKEVKSLPHGAPWLAAKAKLWDAETVESWILKNVRTDGARDFIRTIVGALFCCNTSQLSYLFFLEYFRQGHGLESLISTEGGAQQIEDLLGAHGRFPEADCRSITRQFNFKFTRSGC